MPKETKIYQDDNLEEWEKVIPSIVEEMSMGLEQIYKVPDDAGLFGENVTEPRIKYKRKGDKVIKKGNAWITFGRDRPAGRSSGYGAVGAQRASRIDIVVGRMAAKPQPSGTRVDNSFIADAARIYLSQATKLDESFGIAEGMVKHDDIAGHSGIGIKADGVRIIGREGIKLVTGFATSHDEKNSRGGRITRANPPIELISGNNTGFFEMPRWDSLSELPRMEKVNYLQGVAMGENVREALKELSDILDMTWEALNSIMLEQNAFNGVLAANTAAIARLAGIPAVSPHVVAIYSRQQIRMWKARIKKILWTFYYLKPYGYRYICSRNVYTT